MNDEEFKLFKKYTNISEKRIFEYLNDIESDLKHYESLIKQKLKSREELKIVLRIRGIY